MLFTEALSESVSVVRLKVRDDWNVGSDRHCLNIAKPASHAIDWSTEAARSDTHAFSFANVRFMLWRVECCRNTSRASWVLYVDDASPISTSLGTRDCNTFQNNCELHPGSPQALHEGPMKAEAIRFVSAARCPGCANSILGQVCHPPSRPWEL
jgi:hypothetical protein